MKNLSKELVKIAKMILSAWKYGGGEIKFVVGDLVKFGTRRNVWKITNVNVEYSFYGQLPPPEGGGLW